MHTRVASSLCTFAVACSCCMYFVVVRLLAYVLVRVYTCFGIRLCAGEVAPLLVFGIAVVP